jgi:hypothetical protein
MSSAVAALAQADERGPSRRQPAGGGDKLGERRAIASLQQFDDPRDLGSAPRRGWGRCDAAISLVNGCRSVRTGFGVRIDGADRMVRAPFRLSFGGPRLVNRDRLRAGGSLSAYPPSRFVALKLLLAPRGSSPFAMPCQTARLTCSKDWRCRQEAEIARRNIEQWVRSWRGAHVPAGSAVPDALPQEAVSVPIRARDRLGDLRKAAVHAAIPTRRDSGQPSLSSLRIRLRSCAR